MQTTRLGLVMFDGTRWPRDAWLDAIWDDETLKPNERVIAYAYARYAGSGDVAWVAWDELKRRTGIRSRDAINRALNGLKSAGWLHEVDKQRQHYSARYRLTIPQASVSRTADEPQASVSRTADESRRPSRDTRRPSRGLLTSPRRPSRVPDLSERTLRENSQTQSGARDDVARLAERVGASEDEIKTLIEETRRGRPDVDRPAAYLATLARNGDLDERLAELRAEKLQHVVSIELERARRDPAMRCHHGTDGGRYVRPDTGTSPCAFCRREAERGTA